MLIETSDAGDLSKLVRLASGWILKATCLASLVLADTHIVNNASITMQETNLIIR